MNKKCERCGKEFECKGAESCWCFKESKLTLEQIEYSDCICKECLAIQYRQKLLGV